MALFLLPLVAAKRVPAVQCDGAPQDLHRISEILPASRDLLSQFEGMPVTIEGILVAKGARDFVLKVCSYCPT
jgi:hypothetical protein